MQPEVARRDPTFNAEVGWPDRRADVVEALATLAAEPPDLAADQSDPRWPNISAAIHWLVDDTGWDYRHPVGDIGTILRDEREAAAILAVVSAVVAISARIGPSASDVRWISNDGWHDVRRSAEGALNAMRF